MIGIATELVDLEGDITFDEAVDTKLDDATARVSVSATLDGGGIITHYGFSNADRKFEINASMDESKTSKVKNIFETHQYINISTRLGIFRAAISRLWANFGQIKMTVLIEQKYN